MIRFKCIYCGQRILAPDDGAGKKGQCPECKHELRVPWPAKSAPAISTDISEREKRAKAEIALMNALDSEDTAELSKEMAGWFIPTYDELSLFLMAMTLILLYIGNSQIRSIVYYVAAHIGEGGVFILSLVFVAGFGLSIYHVFTSREKTPFEKTIMMLFAVVTNACTGIIAGWYVIKHTDVHNWLLVFPVWNIINGIMLLLMLRFRIFDERCISDRNASAKQVFLGLIAVFVIFVFCNSVFHLHWAITFSICTIYATSFDKALQSVFPGMTYEDSEQTS